MAKTLGKSLSNRGRSNGVLSAGAAAKARFLSVASLKPVTKRATITSAQADKAVKDYLSAHAK